jgi:squalene-hopene/tetraprenyl-beta-curcumene cyclase
MSAPFQKRTVTAGDCRAAARRAVEYLEFNQNPDGHWCGLLTADSTLESDYILLQLWLYPPVEGRWRPESAESVQCAMRAILKRQLPDGGFNIYAKGPSEISASVKAYCALKLAGLKADDPRMARLRERILALGGIQAANSYVKINLSLFGLFPRNHCPSVPPEVALLPFQFLYQMSSWTRAIVIPLAILHAADPQRPAPEGFNLDELWAPGVSATYRRDERLFSWRNFFLAADRLLKWWERAGLKSVRRMAVKRASEWMIERLDHSDGLGAIYPAMMYAVMALDALGYQPSHRLRVEALTQFNNLALNDGERLYYQPCFSPVWDSAIAAYAVAYAEPGRASADRAVEWLAAREIRRKGDWAVKRPGVEPSGWAFEYRNEFYPDIDDTAMVLLAFTQAGLSKEAVLRGRDWLLAMQGRDGGWAAFDADNDWRFLADVPFADHNAMLDPACADITGRVLEGLAASGVAPANPAMRRGVEWLVRHQEMDGSWLGRWGVAYIYGTCFALRGLAAAGESDREAHVLRGGEWLRSVQNADGGWGESCASYDNGVFTPAESTASQTAWALMGLIAGGDSGSLSVRAGIEYLLRTQQAGGFWQEELSTGTGFPKVFYLRYQLYKDYFPLIALTAYAKAREALDG